MWAFVLFCVDIQLSQRYHFMVFCAALYDCLQGRHRKISTEVCAGCHSSAPKATDAIIVFLSTPELTHA